MLKHIKPKDIVEFFLLGVLVVAVIVIAGILESAPLAQALMLTIVLAIPLWIAWFVLACIQRNKEAVKPKLKISVNGKWVDVDSPAGMAAISTPRRPVQLFDQDEAAITHLDFNNKEKA